MQIRREEKRVEDVVFLVPLLSVKEQRRILFRVAGVAGAPIADLVDKEKSGDGEEEEGSGNFDAMLDGLKSAALALKDPAFLDTYESLIESFTRDGRSKVRYTHANGEDAEGTLDPGGFYDEFFTMRLDLEFQFVWACLEANFAPFIGRAQQAMKRAQEKKEEAVLKAKLAEKKKAREKDQKGHG